MANTDSSTDYQCFLDNYKNMPKLKRGDKLFNKSDNSLLFIGTKDDYVLQKAYSDATFEIFNIIKETDEGFKQEILLLPALFMFRQYMELSLKKAIRDLEIAKELNSEHALYKLWNILKPELMNLPTIEKNDSLKTFESLIQQLCQEDRGSQRFRYTTDTKGNPFGTLEYIDLELLITRCTQMHEFMEGISNLCCNYNDNK